MSRDVAQSEFRPIAGGRGAAERHPEDVRFGERARVLAAEAREARESSESSPPSVANRRALECARDGAGPVVLLYVSAWMGDRQVSFIGEELELPHRAMNDWLTAYT